MTSILKAIIYAVILTTMFQSLVRQMESRESQFNAVQEKGGAMILDRHPSARTVEVTDWFH